MTIFSDAVDALPVVALQKAVRSVRRRYRRSSGARSWLFPQPLGWASARSGRHAALHRARDWRVFAKEVGFRQTVDLLGYARVRDGNTLEVSGTSVRLKGLHCPELSEAGGAQASSVISRMVVGQQVSCEVTGERTYDRMVGRCYVNGTDLAPALIRGGFCARCPRYDPFMWYLPAQLEAGRWRGSMPDYC